MRLFLNGKLIGEKPTGREQAFKADFEVPFEAGTLKAEGIRGGKVVASSVLETAGDAVRLKLTADRTLLDADGQDLAFVTVEAVDTKGRLQVNSNSLVHVAVSGTGTIAAVGNGDGQSKRSYAGETVDLFHGRALVVLRTTRNKGQIKVTAKADGLSTASVAVESREARISPEL